MLGLCFNSSTCRKLCKLQWFQSRWHRPLYEPPCKEHLEVCAIYSETAVTPSEKRITHLELVAQRLRVAQRSFSSASGLGVELVSSTASLAQRALKRALRFGSP